MCRLAADESGVPWHVYKALPYYDRVDIVAYHISKGELDWVRSKKAAIKAKRTKR